MAKLKTKTNINLEKVKDLIEEQLGFEGIIEHDHDNNIDVITFYALDKPSKSFNVYGNSEFGYGLDLNGRTILIEQDQDTLNEIVLKLKEIFEV